MNHACASAQHWFVVGNRPAIGQVGPSRDPPRPPAAEWETVTSAVSTVGNIAEPLHSPRTGSFNVNTSTHTCLRKFDFVTGSTEVRDLKRRHVEERCEIVSHLQSSKRAGRTGFHLLSTLTTLCAPSSEVSEAARTCGMSSRR